MKALIITRHYLDQKLGGPNCSKAFVKALSSIYSDCTLIYPEHNNCTTNTDFITNENLKLVPCYDKRCKIKKCLDMYFGHIHRFGGFVRTYLRDNKFDVIFIDHSFTASSGVLESALRLRGKVVTLHHNVESWYIKDNQKNVLFRLPYNYFSLKAEKKAILKSDLNLTLTQSDKDFFVREYEEKSKSFAVMGVFEHETETIEPVNNESETENVFVISGALNSMQTETAVSDFIENYVPRLNDICPQNKLIITGRNPSERIIAAAKRFGNITIVPNPDDILAVIRKGAYYICPLFTGSGLKLRIMDGLRLGLPVLAHKVSCHGYETILQDGFMFKYSDLDTFETGIRDLLSLKFNHKQVQESFFSHFSYDAGEQRLREILIRHGLL